MYYTPADIAQLGTILGIWAHPDDEVWASGGIMAAAVRGGQRVACVTATRGEAGKTADESRWPQANLAAIRQAELEASLAVIGVTEHYWLDCADGHLVTTGTQKPVSDITTFIQTVRPDTILTFGSDGLTGHDDHKTIYRWARMALRQAGSAARLWHCVESAERYARLGQDPQLREMIYFDTPKPVTMPEATAELCFTLPDDLLALKLQAMLAHASQAGRLMPYVERHHFARTLWGSECFTPDTPDA